MSVSVITLKSGRIIFALFQHVADYMRIGDCRLSCHRVRSHSIYLSKKVIQIITIKHRTI